MLAAASKGCWLFLEPGEVVNPAIRNDHSFGRISRSGAVSVGVVVHTNCVSAGHGPGVTTLMTYGDGKIFPQLSSAANVASLLKLRADI